MGAGPVNLAWSYDLASSLAAKGTHATWALAFLHVIRHDGDTSRAPRPRRMEFGTEFDIDEVPFPADRAFVGPMLNAHEEAWWFQRGSKGSCVTDESLEGKESATDVQWS